MAESAKRRSEKAANSAPPPSDFEGWSRWLLRAYRKGVSKETEAASTLSQRKRAAGAFKLLAYRYYRDLKEAGLMNALRQYVEARDGSQWRGHGESGALWIMRLVTNDAQAHPDPIQTDKMRKARSRYAAAFELADLNDVRPDLLLGFLHEAGPTALIEKNAKKRKKYAWAESYRETVNVERPRRRQIGSPA